MAAITLEGARNLTAALLDDPNHVRWSHAVIGVALQQALSSCLSDYAANGGDDFDEEFSITTTTAGLGTLTTPLVLLRAVQVLTGTVYYPIVAQNRAQRVVNDTVARDLRCLGVRDFTIPTAANPTDPLIGVSTVAAGGTWAAFERWVCLEAALVLAVQDNDQRAGIIANAERTKASVMERANTYTSRPLPDPETALIYASWWRRLGYIYLPGQTGGTVQVISDLGRWI